MIKVNLFPALTAPSACIFLSILCNEDEVALAANLGKTSLINRRARSNNTFLPKIPNILSRNPPD